MQAVPFSSDSSSITNIRLQIGMIMDQNEDLVKLNAILRNKI